MAISPRSGWPRQVLCSNFIDGETNRHPLVVSWEVAFDGLNVLDRAKLTGFELKQNPYAQAKDMAVKRGHTIERLAPILTLRWSLEQLVLLFNSVVTSRRKGRFALVKVKLYRMKKQPSSSLPYTQFVVQSGTSGHSGYGRFYGSFVDQAEEIEEGTEITLVQPKVELEGKPGEETVIVTLDDTYEPPCAIATTDDC